MAGRSEPMNHRRENDFAGERTDRRAFTLVELLVVIGIIAVLIGILLPALGAARKQANATKCAAQLREIGNALALYAAENRGYWPVLQHEANLTEPGFPNEALRSNPPRNDYWYQFLLKYFTKRQFSTTTGTRLIDFRNTPLWGCPAVDKENFDVSTSSAEFNSGYGFNFSPGYWERQPANVNANNNLIAWIKLSQWVGKYWKASQWTRPYERCIVADARAWFLECTSFNNPLGEEPLGVGYNGNYNNQFNRYRHGDRGKKKQAFNVLFCDGHVATLQDIKQGIISIRRRYPN
jgi:prepilin-type N-terminal cleavage/methylation domain-containing protein/prepilin-type processing-associated H-X9-DG protein